MLNYIVRSFLSICIVLQCGSSKTIDEQDINNAINTFMAFVEFPNDINNTRKDKLIEILHNIIVHKKKLLSGYKLISEINEILRDGNPVTFEKLICELNDYKGLLSDIKSIISNTINEQLDYEELIKIRNDAVKQKIQIYQDDNNPSFVYPKKSGEKLSIYFREINRHVLTIKRQENNKKDSLQKTSSPKENALLHELLHLYHYIKNPVIFHLFGTKCVDTRIAKVYDFDKIYYSTIEGYVNIEELLTIRGKPSTMYFLSENSYRLEKKEPLRYSICDGDNFDNKIDIDKPFFERYHKNASVWGRYEK